MDEGAIHALIKRFTRGRQFGLLGEAGVNVLQLNLALDAVKP
jgi:K+-transporting ATPase ATPase C chain